MAYEISWYMEGRIIASKFYGDGTLDDIRHCSQQAHWMVNNGTAPVHHIVNLLELDTYPPNIRQIMHAIVKTDAKQLGWMVLISNNTMVNYIVSVASYITKARLKIVKNPDDALQYLFYVDTTLNNPTNDRHV